MSKFDLGLKWTVEVRDKKGKLLFKKTGKSKSLLRNFMYWLQSKFQVTDTTAQTSTWTAPDTSNTSRTMAIAAVSKEGSFGAFGGLVNNDAFGLRIGTGDAAVTPPDYSLEAIINHGAGAGQMVYGAQTYEAVAVVGAVTSFRVSRPFTNNSGDTITVKEIGAAMLTKGNDGTDRFFLYLRDVLASSVDVPDGSTFTLRYTFSVTS